MSLLTHEVRAVLDALDLTSTDYTQARTLPGAVYTSEEFYAFEKEAIFAREWLCLGHVSQLPNRGDYFTIQVADEPLIVVRDDAGEVRVMSAICQHRGYPIAVDGDKGTVETVPLRLPLLGVRPRRQPGRSPGDDPHLPARAAPRRNLAAATQGGDLARDDLREHGPGRRPAGPGSCQARPRDGCLRRGESDRHQPP